MMKKLLSLFTLVLFLNIGFAQVADSTQTDNQPKYQKQVQPPKAEKKEKKQSGAKKMFFGGSLGFSFGSVTSIRIYPLVGYKLTPKLSVGVKALYEFNSYDYYGVTQKYNNYGGSLFARFRFIPQAYLHAEYSYVNYELSGFNNEKYRVGVPFVFLGAGFSQRIGKSSYAYAEILFDVLNDSNSPYAEWTPFYSVGVSVGF
jgi:hypothetical protein